MVATGEFLSWGGDAVVATGEFLRWGGPSARTPPPLESATAVSLSQHLAKLLREQKKTRKSKRCNPTNSVACTPPTDHTIYRPQNKV